MSDKTERLDTALRALLDEFTPGEVVEALCNVCSELAQEPDTNDEESGHLQDVATALDRALQRLDN